MTYTFSAEQLGIKKSPVRVTDLGCWVLARQKSLEHYAQATRRGKSVVMHRFSYEAYIGPIPAGLFVCHKCDVPACFNPNHLFLGTAKDNARDMMLKGRGRFKESGRMLFLTPGAKAPPPDNRKLMLKSDKTKPTSVRLSDNEMKALVVVAKEDGRSLSNAIRRGLKMYLMSRGVMSDTDDMEKALEQYLSKGETK